MIDKIYCINLDRRPDRWAQAKEQFDRHQLPVERFAAIDGNDFKLKYPTDNGNNGCTLSHYFLIERAKILGFDAVMIFEDDAELHPAFGHILSQCIDQLPTGWDMLYFGGSHRQPPSYVSDRVMRVHHTLTTHGYILRSSMFDQVIANFKNLDNPVDCFYAAWQKQFNVYVTNPPIAWQRRGFSDICRREMEYEWIRTNEQ